MLQSETSITAAAHSGLPGIDRSQPGSVHLVGVCGSGMKAAAEYFLQAGCQVSGSDLNANHRSIVALQAQGLQFFAGHAAEHVPPQTTLVVSSPAVPANNQERIAARELAIPNLTYPQYLGMLMHERQGVCVAGTHGKSTTTAMTSAILQAAGWDPSSVFGAERCDTGASGHCGTSDWLVVESCEYQNSFLEFSPHAAALLNIEPDHFDSFPAWEQLLASFQQFAERVPREGVLLGSGDSIAVRDACRNAQTPLITFGDHEDCDWYAEGLRRTAYGMRFRVYRRGTYVCEIRLDLPGRHNVSNALAAAALCGELGAGSRAIRDGLESFSGIRRRFEDCGTWRGVTIIDDYAHHPTAIEATLETARELFGRRRIWCAFQPHQISRTEALMTEFALSLCAADRVLIPPVFAAREGTSAAASMVAQQLCQRIHAEGGRAAFCPSLEKLVSTLHDELSPGDVLITMGAGSIDQVLYELTCPVFRDSSTGRAAGPIHVAEGGRSRPVLPHSA